MTQPLFLNGFCAGFRVAIFRPDCILKITIIPDFHGIFLPEGYDIFLWNP
jgi:hypothetical protein